MDNNLSHTIKLRIKEIAAAQGISLYQLSYRSGMTQSTLNNLMNRETSSPTIATIKRLCDGFGITLGEFFATIDFDQLQDIPEPKARKSKAKDISR